MWILQFFFWQWCQLQHQPGASEDLQKDRLDPQCYCPRASPYLCNPFIKHKNDPDFELATFSKSTGHSSIRTTMEIYAHLDMTQNRFVQRSMEDLKDF